MTREYNTRTIFANQPKICVYCESSGEKHCNACGLYATLDFLNSKDEKMGYSLNDKSDNNKKILCADCLTTSAPMWRIRQDGQRVCNACGLQ
ncbi:hypothetical protein RhiirA4_316212 [Rhizophagus irregularis]|uniref:GATA-type domain-containing protein n=1 Tax=Rhizophagus irregularis TaxID=588596 RepID=A0A2I1G7Y0_9GLOM|nr:hypothetical protein RhiirA4_316212 [Rhizophagus irregularis]